ncbi:MAG: MATE family efflux transporter [Ruminococcus sp.]|jgi:putative MATE family efflux protein
MNKGIRKGDLTSGPIGRQLLLFALPLLGASLIQQLYNTVDLFFVGNLLGTQATAAVGASSLLTNCIVGFFTGLSLGTGVIISLAVGEGDKDKIRKVIHTAMGISLTGGVFLTLLGILMSRQMLIWMNTPEDILEQGLVYIRIYLLSMVPLFVYNMNAGIIRARGDSRTPMAFQMMGAVINIALDWISMRYMGMGVDGAAWATFISQLAAAAGSVVYLMRQKDEYRLELQKIRINGAILKRILSLGVPAGLQNLVITISNIFVQTAINGLGVTVIAAFTAYFKVELLIYLPIMAFGQAATTFTGQNMGAGKPDRIKKGLRNCIVMGIIYAAAMAALLLLTGRTVFGLFNSDRDVIEIGMRIIRVTFPFYWLYVILEVHADALRGIGRSVPPMVLILLCICVFRTVLLFVFHHIWGSLEAVAAVYPCAWLAAAVCLTLCWRKSRKRLR